MKSFLDRLSHSFPCFVSLFSYLNTTATFGPPNFTFYLLIIKFHYCNVLDKATDVKHLI